jgi:hypothetical protein
VGEISVKTGNNARNGKNSLNRLIRCVCGKKSAQIREILTASQFEEMTAYSHLPFVAGVIRVTLFLVLLISKELH